jgi:hypothetical protein
MMHRIQFDALNCCNIIRNSLTIHLTVVTLDGSVKCTTRRLHPFYVHNSLITSLVPQRKVPRHKENVHDSLQELYRDLRSTTIEADLQSIRDCLGVMKRHISVIEEEFGQKLERIMPELEEMTELVKQPSKKHPSGQRAFIEALIEWVAVNSISFRSANHPLFREMVRCANPDFSVPMYNTPRPHIKRLADAYRQLPTHQEKCYCSLMVD